MHLRPQGFFQTNTYIAAALYRQARQWINDVDPESIWDLYSGVGGFALHCASEGRTVPTDQHGSCRSGQDQRDKAMELKTSTSRPRTLPNSR